MKRAVIRTEHADAKSVGAAVRPDNTDEMTTEVASDTVETTIERPSVSGLRTTLDDYLVNLTVADQLTATNTDDPNL